MFTKNYQLLRERLFRGGTSSRELTSTGGVSCELDSSYAYFRYLDIGYYMARIATRHETYAGSSSIIYSTGLFGVVFGSGTTKPTIDDIDLENRITAGLSVTCGGLNLGKVADGQYCAWASYTVTNTSEEEITISEIGVLTCYFNSGHYPILMERTVLDEPITIPAGEQKIITYKINFYH